MKGFPMRETGAQAIANAIQDSGVHVITHVPGFGGTEVFAELCKISSDAYSNSFNEEVAYSISHGASLVGQRSATLMKAHGFAKAANSTIDSLSAGTTAGFVSLVFNDIHGKHSDSIFDIAEFLRGSGMPCRMLHGQNMYEETFKSFKWSEVLQLPVVLLVDADDLDQMETYTPLPSSKPSAGYQRDVTQHVLCPLLAEYQHQVLQAKLKGRDWKLVRKPVLPRIPDDLPKVWHSTVRLYAPLLTVFKRMRGEVVTGDTGMSTLFAFPPFHCVDICTYMGGSIPLAIGAFLSGYENTWALTGDFSFIAAGHLGLMEAIQRGISLKVLIFSNGKAQATGGQFIQAGILEHILKGYESYLRHIDNPQDTNEVESVLEEANKAKEMRIVIADYLDVE